MEELKVEEVNALTRRQRAGMIISEFVDVFDNPLLLFKRNESPEPLTGNDSEQNE